VGSLPQIDIIVPGIGITMFGMLDRSDRFLDLVPMIDHHRIFPVQNDGKMIGMTLFFLFNNRIPGNEFQPSWSFDDILESFTPNRIIESPLGVHYQNLLLFAIHTWFQKFCFQG
jgi:hypothetical protein